MITSTILLWSIIGCILVGTLVTFVVYAFLARDKVPTVGNDTGKRSLAVALLAGVIIASIGAYLVTQWVAKNNQENLAMHNVEQDYNVTIIDLDGSIPQTANKPPAYALVQQYGQLKRCVIYMVQNAYVLSCLEDSTPNYPYPRPVPQPVQPWNDYGDISIPERGTGNDDLKVRPQDPVAPAPETQEPSNTTETETLEETWLDMWSEVSPMDPH